jgi:hypothetical protein
MIKPKLLLHICCAPCAGLISRQLKEKFAVTVYFDNSNIYPEAEFQKRAQEAEKFFKAEGVEFVLTDWQHADWLKLVRGLEQEPEKGRRCQLCYDHRLRQAAQYSQEHGFDYFTTSLSISPYKDQQIIFDLSQKIGRDYGIKFLDWNFRTDNGYQKSVEFSRANSFYRQKYCGCEFSLKSGKIKSAND